MEMEGMCTGCLSTGRTLYFIGETGYYNLYTQILSEIPIYDLSQVCVRVCWECRARLRTMHRFKLQVQRNYCDLMNHIPPQAASGLSSHSLYHLSYPDVKGEVWVKCEDQLVQSEPQPFASVLSFAWEGPNENIKPLAKKKKPKILLKVPQNYISKKLPKSTKKKRKKKSIDKKLATKNDLIEVNIKNTENIDNNIDDYIDDSIDDIEDSIDDNIEDNTDKSNVHENKMDEKNTEEKNDSLLKSKEDAQAIPNDILTKPVATNIVKLKRPRDMTPLPARPQCQECGKVFSSKKTYRYHLNVLHKGQNQYPCPRCGKVYQWKSNLGRHMRSHRAVDDGELHCSLCDKTFASVATYRQHLRISRRHVAETDFSYACDECGKRFVNKTRLRDHVDWDHLNRIKFRCQLCDKPFKCHTSLYVHKQNVHVGKEKKDNLCHVCGKSYQNAAKLKYHITAMHSGETPYRCSACDAAFGWYSSLYRHMREVHHKLKGVPKKAKKLKQPRNSPPMPAPHYAAL